MKPVNAPPFGALLKHYRLAAGLSQEALAEQAHLSARGISDLERGVRRAPYPQTLARLANALHLSTEQRQQLFAAAHPSPTARGMTSAPGGPLPQVLTPLLGREQEEATITHHMQQETIRLLTLTGPAGVGKTRLALHIAEKLQKTWAHRVRFLALAPLREADLVLPALAQSLGLSDSSEPILSLLTNVLQEQTLLLLDNCEHILEVGVQLSALLSQCPHLKILATSRTPFRVRGEYELPLRPLALPPLAPLPPLPRLEQYPSVALFTQRARALQPDFALTPSSAAAVAELCHRLDGLPLAIELAAARVKVLPPPILQARLEQAALPLLVDGPHDLPERQQTMRSAIGWSYSLLPPQEQALFRRLSVFAGSWSLEAAEEIAILKSDQENDLLLPLASLVEKSLVQPTEPFNGEARFRILEVMREYGMERLIAGGEADLFQRQHAAYYIRLADRAQQALTERNQGAWLDRLEQEQDNLRAVLRWACMQGESRLGYHLVGTLWRFWEVRGKLSEGVGWLEHLLTQEGRMPAPDEEAEALPRIPPAAYKREEHLQRRNACLEAALIRYQELGDNQGSTQLLYYLAAGLRLQGDYVGAAARAEECLALYRQLGLTWGIASVQISLNVIAREQGVFEQAAALCASAEELARACGDLYTMVRALANRGEVVFYQGQMAQARTLLEEALALCETLGMIGGTAASCCLLLGEVAREAEDYVQAWDWYAESLRRHQTRGARRSIPECLECFARLEIAQGQFPSGVQLLGAADALREAFGVALPPVERAALEPELARARVTLGGEAFAREWATGRALQPEAVIASVLRKSTRSRLPPTGRSSSESVEPVFVQERAWGQVG